MFYLTDIIGKSIFDPKGKPVARVRDLVAEVLDSENGSSGYLDEEGELVERDVPVVRGVLARPAGTKQTCFVSVDELEALNPGGVRLRSTKADWDDFERRPGELLLARDLWDKQIIDLLNRRVVRVNDVVLTQARRGEEEEPTEWWVRGVDFGLGALARRLHVVRPLQKIAPKALQPQVVRWQHIDMFGANVPGGVPLPHNKLAGFHPVEIARLTDGVSYHLGAEIISSLDNTLAADTLEEIADERRTDIVEYIPEDRAADILEEMAPDEASDLLSDLPGEKAKALLDEMDQEEADEVRNLMRYAERTAGGIMTTDFVRVLPTMTVEEVIDANRDILSSADLIYYMYVVDSAESNKLIGIVTVRDLLVNTHDTPIERMMMTEFISVRPNEAQQEVARKMAEYNLLALPVVDGEGSLAGVVTVDDALDALLPEGWKRRLPRVFS